MIQINTNSSIPLYEQIMARIKELILKDALREGDKLPSIRELACIITVNPNTISKSYLSLEKAGLIETIRGKGTFIKNGANLVIKTESINLLQRDITNVLKNALSLNLSLLEVIKIEQEIYKNIQGEENGRN
jgi:GntR family transcriptional regulator